MVADPGLVLVDDGVSVFDEVVAGLLAAGDARSEHTLASYRRRWRMWEAFALHHGVTAIPADPDHVAAFALARWRAGVSDATVSANLSAVLWFHCQLAGELGNTCDLAKRVLGRLRRESVRPAVVAPAPVLSVGALEQMVLVPAKHGMGIFSAKVLRLMSGAEPRQLGPLTVADVTFGPRDSWVELRTPAVAKSRARPAIAPTVFRFDRGLTALDCPVEAARILVGLAAEGDGRLFPMGYPPRGAIKGFVPGSAVEGVPGRIQVRNRAMVRVGYHGALRVQELVRARVEDLERTPTGYRLVLVDAKTSRSHGSQFVLLSHSDGLLDPITSLDEWLALRGDHDGPLFCTVHHGWGGAEVGAALSAGEVSAVIGDLAVAAGLPTTVSGYSLRRSWATHTYLRDPKDLGPISLHLRHSTVDMTTRYIDDLGLHLLDGSDYLSSDAVLVSGARLVKRPKDLGFDQADMAALLGEVASMVREVRPRAASTEIAERTMWAVWSRWSERHSVDALPASAESLAFFAADRATDGIAASSLRAQLRLIRRRHEEAGFDSGGLTELANEISTGLARSSPRERMKAPVLTFDELVAMAGVAHERAEVSGSLEAHRDLVMVTVAYSGALRVDDLYRARIELIDDVAYGLSLRFSTSKENQFGTHNESVLLLGRGDVLDPVDAIHNWKAVSGLETGPLIPVLGTNPGVPLSKDSIPDRLRSLATAAGVATRPTGHSLRRSWATHAYAAGVDPVTLSRHLRHRDLTTTLGYVEALSPWRDNAAVTLLSNNDPQGL